MTVPQIAGETTIMQQRAAGGAQLLQHDGEFGDAAASAAVLLGEVDAEVAELAPASAHSSSVCAPSRTTRVK